MENTLDVIEHLLNNVQEKVSEKQAYSFQLRKETEEQKPKLERVTKQVLMSCKNYPVTFTSFYCPKWQTQYPFSVKNQVLGIRHM